MAATYGKRKQRQNNIVYTVITVVLLCAIFLSMVSWLHTKAEDEAYEMLHLQTKQIKDDLTLQIKSDRENLVTMAHFAAKLYADGENYDRMFASFEPIGLFSNIGILNPDNTFVTKAGSLDLNGKISFEEEARKGAYISGRVSDLTRKDYEIIRSAVPIKVGEKTVGMLYGVIKLETIGEKYVTMARELDAQLFVYDKESGKFVIDTINKTPGELSQFENRKYNDGYTYEELKTSDKGFSSFKSILTGEDLYVHYSTLEDSNWGIMLARYESQVFADTHNILSVLVYTFLAMAVVMVLYVLIVMADERRRNAVTICASHVRKTLLEINQQQNNITEALRKICEFPRAKSAYFFDTDGENYHYVLPTDENNLLVGENRKYFIEELLHYSAQLRKTSESTVSVMRIVPNEHLSKTNPRFFEFLKVHGIREASFAAVTSKDNQITIIGTINPARSRAARLLAENIAVCFSIALYNKKHLNRTEHAATTDSLTGVLNRVVYKRDLYEFDNEKPRDFSCVYIDVNELHLINNKYGHAKGDEMLIFIANTLKEVFYGHNIYRMGGDEFLVFAKETDASLIKNGVSLLVERLKPMNYNVAIGTSYRTQNTDTEEMVREAEIRMYEAKAQYYQNKENKSTVETEDISYVQTKTGIREIDTMISVLKEHYNGIYRVSLDTNRAYRILMPSYLGYKENEEQFSKLLEAYVGDMVHPDFHRSMASFLNYDAIRKQLMAGKTPKITYKRVNGEIVILSVYKLNDEEERVNETLWVFAKD